MRVFTWIVVALIVIGGIWYFLSKPASTAPAATSSAPMQSASTTAPSSGAGAELNVSASTSGSVIPQ